METENDNVVVSEEVLRKMVTKLLSIMNPEQLEELSLWLKNMNLKIQDLNGVINDEVLEELEDEFLK